MATAPKLDFDYGTRGKRVLAASQRQHQRAAKSLPLGVSDTYRYWGDDATIYVKRGKGALPVGSRRQPLCRFPPGLGSDHPRLWRRARRPRGAARHRDRRHCGARDRAGSLGRRADDRDGAVGREGALRQFRLRGGGDGAARGARLFRPRRLRDGRRRVPRHVRSGAVAHADGELEPGLGRSARGRAVRQGHPQGASRPGRRGAAQRCGRAGGPVQARDATGSAPS